MKALIVTYGTRGDVQPYVALADALHQGGHEAVLALPRSSAELAEPYRIEIAPLVDEMNEMLAEPVVRGALESNFNGLGGKLTGLWMVHRTGPMFTRVLNEIAALSADWADVLVHPVNFPVHHLAEKLGIPAVPVGLQPGWVPTSTMPNPHVPFRVPKMLNRISYRTSWIAMGSALTRAARWRSETLGLDRRRHQNDTLRRPDGRPAWTLHAYSEQVLPPELIYPDWALTTGYWFLPRPRGWRPPQRLVRFLESGDPPVYLGFGSMTGGDIGRAGPMIAEAVSRLGLRAVVATGSGRQDDDQDRDDAGHLLMLDQVPHDWLFPRVAAVVHHGGGGTTGAALAAGRPQLICPFVADQPFWARRMQQVGVAPEPLPQRQLTADRLTAALRTVINDESLADRAAELGATIRAEAGVREAVRFLERVVS